MEITTVLLLIAIVAIFVGASVLKSKDSTVNIYKQPMINPRISKITDDIYISDAINAMDYQSLKLLGIKQILIAGNEIPRHGDLHFKVFHVKINDLPNENIKKYFNPSFNFIKKNKTLVHCAMGMSRSVSIVIAYLMRANAMSYEEAHATVKARRNIANPNSGFIAQLKQYEAELSAKRESTDEDDVPADSQLPPPSVELPK
jgi:hypothetical protein